MDATNAGPIAETADYLRRDQFVVTDHARREMAHDSVLLADVISACLAGEVIEDYPDAYPLPACLILGPVPDGRRLHVCLSHPPRVKIITVYVPDPAKWEADCRTRKGGG